MPHPTNDRPRRMETVQSPVQTPHSGAASVRILRLIEYLIRPDQSADETLRRSLIGRMNFPWGSITATIVDSVDPRQEDLLSLARRQPGVWVGNPMQPAPPPDGVISYAEGARRVLQQFDEDFMRSRETVAPSQPPQSQPPPMPPTGPTFTRDDQILAGRIVDMGGYKLAYTLALALQGISEELSAVMERERFLTQAEALSLANALLQQVPPDWTGDAVEPSPETQEQTHATEQRVAAAVSRVQAASHVAAVFRERKE